MGRLGNLRVLHLENNQLTGELPKELGRLGNLKALSVGGDITLGGCSLDTNSYTGTILEPVCQFAAFVSVSAGDEYNCALLSNGALTSWGWNSGAQARLPEGKFASVSVDDFHTCGVKTDGAVACWGRGQVTQPEGEFASVSIGRGQGCGLKTDGTVACWELENRGSAAWTTAGEFASISLGPNPPNR